MRPKDRDLARQLDAGLRKFDQRKRPLPGIKNPTNREVFVEQLIESIRRIRYVSVISTQELSHLRADPSSDLFDPLKAAVLLKHQGQIDEAFWLVFLSVYFGKHRRAGWRSARDVYGRLGNGVPWDWVQISSHPERFREWLAVNQAHISRRFGNHRKYETLKTSSPRGTAAVVESYVKWVRPPRTHLALVQEAQTQVGRDPRKTFDYLYRSLADVISFGRTARFDYLTMVGKLGLAEIEPGSTYMQGATGPLKGARLLFGGSKTALLSCSDLDVWLVQLDAELNVGMHGMQVFEDALCNWQKSPGHFESFRG